MYKVLLVDDEESTIKLLYNMVEWGEKGYRITATAKNGQEAVIKYNEHRPNLIFVDIKMPILDGLEFIREIRKIDNDVKIVILSAYSEFSYAQTAIKYGVHEYLLKPINRYKLHEIIDLVKLELDEKMKEKLMLDSIKRKIKKENVIQCFTDIWIKKRVEEKHKQMISDFCSGENYYFIICKWYSKIENAWGAGEEIECLEELENLMISEKIPVSIIMQNSVIGTFILVDGCIQEKEVLEKFGICIQECFRNININYNISVVKANMKAVKYEELFHVLCSENSTFYGTNQEIIFYDYSKPKIEISSNKIYKENRSAIVKKDIKLDITSAIVERDSKKIFQHIDEYFKQIEYEKLKPEVVKSDCINLIIELKRQVIENYLEEKIKVVQNMDFSKLQQSFHICAIKNFITYIIQNLFNELEKLPNEQGQKAIIYQAIEFTKNNYTRLDFSVRMVADYVGLSKNYFLKLYKDQYSINFWNIVTKLRINRAKVLLVTTQKKNYEISQLIGYESEYHFNRKFKECVGITPLQYRKAK